MQILIAAISILLLIFTQVSKADEASASQESSQRDEYQFTLGASGIGYGTMTGLTLGVEGGFAKRLGDHFQVNLDGRANASAEFRSHMVTLGVTYNFSKDFRNTWFVGAGLGNRQSSVETFNAVTYTRVGYRMQIGESNWSYTPTFNVYWWDDSLTTYLDFLQFSYSF